MKIVLNEWSLDRALWGLRIYEKPFGYAHTDKQPKCYLSGPMTGLPHFNKFAFEKCSKALKRAGWEVFSPHENDAEAGVELEGKTGHEVWSEEGLEGFSFKAAMAKDLFQVCSADAVIVMPGWEWSEGALLEVEVAHRVGVPVYTFLHQRKIEAPERESHEFSSRSGVVPEPTATEVPSTPERSRSGLEGVVEREEGAAVSPAVAPSTTLPLDSALRKAVPIASGVLDYFPAALMEVARVSKYGNDKHNPGEPLHHARGKSMDHADSIARHLIDRGHVDPDTGMRHSAELAWRALALLQQELEDVGAPLARGARL